MALPKIFRYSLNRKLRGATNGIMRWVTAESNEERLDLHKEQLKKILLVRATFRMGHSILAIPAILLFRKHFPHARIDFVGAPVSAKLFRNLPIDHHFSVTRRYPGSAWDYPLLLRQLRSVGYDIAVDLSCSQSAMASFIVGFSRARFRVGGSMLGFADHPRETNIEPCRLFLGLLAWRCKKIFPHHFFLIERSKKEESE